MMDNENFIAKFTTANDVFLPYGICDHNPAILNIPQAMVKKNKAFRMANYIAEKVDDEAKNDPFLRGHLRPNPTLFDQILP